MVKSGRGRYNTGHWTDDESRLLHVGLERHGRDWVAISRLVGTRCVSCMFWHFFLANATQRSSVPFLVSVVGSGVECVRKIPELPRAVEAIQWHQCIFQYLVVSVGCYVGLAGLRIRLKRARPVLESSLSRYPAQLIDKMNTNSNQLERDGRHQP